MKRILIALLLHTGLAATAQQKEILIYHPIKTDANGKIIPWFNPDLGTSYDHVINKVWNFWDTMRHDYNGLPYYMNHQVWNAHFDDPRGIGGDQFAMALSSWRLYYAYSGNERVKADMHFIADYYLTHGLSPANCKWPNLPYPYNTFVYSGQYDGDMRAGYGVLQPDKAGSFGLELVHLYKMSNGFNIDNNTLYLDAAVKIANTLAAHITQGDTSYSPLPFKVNPITGGTALLRNHDYTGTWIDTAGYSSNWAPTLQLFLDLEALHVGDSSLYKSSFDKLITWMKAVPMKLNKWGPFFEDVDWWSETQINAMTWARFIMEHTQYFPAWQGDVRKIIEWVHTSFANEKWKKYGVVVTNEQTVYQTPGNSHSSRQAADELLYVTLSGDSTLYANAVRELSWATYMVDFDGKNCFPQDEPWLTDGYGDYVRHFLRAMDAVPKLAPYQDHILSSSSVIQQADYRGDFHKFIYLNFQNIDSGKVKLFYRAFDENGTERIRLITKPPGVLLENKPLKQNDNGEGYSWQPLGKGGLLIVRRLNGRNVIVLN